MKQIAQLASITLCQNLSSKGVMQEGRPIWASCLLLWLVAADLHAREVMSWVPPYAIDECKTTLQSDYGDFSPSDALTRLGLQFWIPTVNGGAVKTTEYREILDSDIAWFRNWGSDNGVEILLCIYNNVDGSWNWNLALSAFATNRSALVSNLVLAVENFDLDGVDIDFEGLVTPSGDERIAFRLFLEDLSAELQSRGKVLTVDSFHSPLYNAPNMSWWEDWVDLVDGVHSMGYDDLYEGSTQTLWGIAGHPFRYSWQQNYGVETAGLAPEQVSMGLPGWSTDWGSGGRGSNLLSHIHECIYDCTVPASVCIWDMQLTGTSGSTSWHSSQVWQALAQLAKYKSIPIDSDSDNMADVWEIMYFGGTNEIDGGATEDKDSDGYLNLEEYIAGTDPTNNSSRFILRIHSEGKDAVAISYQTRRVNAFDAHYGDRQRYYSLAQSSDLLQANWWPVAGYTNLVGDNKMIFYTNAAPPQAGSYRGKASLRP